MKKLSRIIFINWYLFEAEEWDVHGHVALLGKNGTGKSSFIDAIQLIMLGGNKSDWSPNAKASDKHHKRDIRSYVLGIVKDEQAIGNSAIYQPRQDALSRVVLVFKDDQTGEAISVGGGFSAQRSEPDAQIEGYFIAHGLDLHLKDLIDEESCVLSYQDTKALMRNNTEQDKLFLFAHEPKRFMDQLMYSLGPDNRPTVLEKVRRAFKQSINLSGLEGSVSDFVKNSILDPEPLNLVQVRQSLDSYRNKQVAVTKIKFQIQALAEIDALYQRAKKAGERRAGYAWCVEELRFNGITQHIEELRGELQGLWEQYKATKNSRNQDNRELLIRQSQVEEMAVALKGDKSVSQQEKLKERRETLQASVGRSNNQLMNIKHQIQRASDVIKFSKHLSADFVTMLNDLVSSTDEGDGWPHNPSSVDEIISEVRVQFPLISDQIDEKRKEIAIEVDQINKATADNSERLETLKKGGVDLRPETRALMDLLRSEGIESKPVCQLVEVTDTMWQPAIESFLRNNTEALIVAPDDAQDAVEIYRKAKKHLYGATVVNTKLVMGWKDQYEPGTAAVLIEGSDLNAVAFIRRLLKGIRLVNETSEFMQESRALTKDGMFIRLAGIQRLRLPEVPQLGHDARVLQIQLIESRIRGQISRLTELNEFNIDYKFLFKNINTLAAKFEDISNLKQIMISIHDELRQIDTLTQQINAIDISHVDALRNQHQQFSVEVESLRSKIKRHDGDLGKLRASYKYNNGERNNRDRQLPAIADLRRSITNNEDYKVERARSLYDAIEQEHDLDNRHELDQVLRKISLRSEEAGKEQHNCEMNAREKLGSYMANYPMDGFWRDSDTQGTAQEVYRVMQQLKDIGLHDRENEVREALYKVQRVIRSDLAIRLRGHINNMKRRLSELNRELQERPFSSNQKYEFTYRRLDEYSELLRFIDLADEESVTNTNTLFDEFSHLDKWIEQILDANQGDILGDYRNYFHFDIAIKDEEAGITELLSRKIGSASGGEHRTPFYVAMGASLASAYRIERMPDGSMHGGVSLYLADEAFEKMDRPNTLQAAGYLQSIGLQLFVASPDDAEHRLREVVDTVMFFLRDGAEASIEIDYVTPKARDLLADVSGKRRAKVTVESS